MKKTSKQKVVTTQEDNSAKSAETDDFKLTPLHIEILKMLKDAEDAGRPPMKDEEIRQELDRRQVFQELKELRMRVTLLERLVRFMTMGKR